MLRLFQGLAIDRLSMPFKAKPSLWRSPFLRQREMEKAFRISEVRAGLKMPGEL